MEAEYSENGRQIFENFCSTAENQPTMLPRAPEQTYIDIYPEPGPSFRDDKRRQLDYETEVKMYRALEGLDGNYIVLHSFKYTHEQYRMCDKTHVGKGCKECKFKFNIEGECDFLIICSNSFVVIEVKNMEHGEWVECEPDFHLCSIGEDWEPECTTRDKQLRALVGTYTKSVEQRYKVAKLIRCIDKDANILLFTAYPNFSKRFKDQFQLSDDELSTIMFKEDICLKEFKDISNKSTNTDNISAFAAWWADNVTQATPSVRRVSKIMPGYNKDSHEKVKYIMLAIWATEKGKCDQSKCSLGKCIMDINKELKKGHITFETKKRAPNPDVVKSPDFINNYVGVLNLTTQQYSVFESDVNLMWINGPAGTGKTVILCSKIIQLIQSDGNNKVVVFKFTGEGNNSQHYQCALDKAGIEYELISSDAYQHTLTTESSVYIVEMDLLDTKFTDKLSELSGYHVFVDDIQCIFLFNVTVEQCTDLINKLLKFSENKKFWIACDIAQMWGIIATRDISLNLNNVLTDELDTSQRRILTKNLRNTCDLSNILSVLRGEVVKLCSPESGNLDLVLPAQSQGHFIHGPLTVIYVFNDFNVDSIVHVFDTELDRLCAELNYSDIGVVYTGVYSGDVLSLVRDSVYKRCNNTDVKIAVCDSGNSSSAEWPAVVVLCEAWNKESTGYLSSLYLTLSRARVHCTVIIYPEEGETLDTYVLLLLERLSNYARIIQH